jgi:hypothetical protein
MATYLDLVNKVINESGSEQDELTSGTWSSAEAGKKIYPRIKRNVSDAWKEIQLSRDQWQFRSSEMQTVLNPRIRLNAGFKTLGTPSVGAIFVGATSGFQITVSSVIVEDGAWANGDAVGMIEFVTYAGQLPIVGETFNEQSSDGAFTYLGKGDYNFLEVDSTFRNIQWATFVAYKDNGFNNPVIYMPWDNWKYKELDFSQSSTTTPLYVSQNPQGNVTFYPHNLNPFRVSFIYGRSPQILTAYDDTPLGIPAEFHDWIAWEALKKLAMYDKNPDLFAYAREQTKNYQTKAESNFMPLVSYKDNQYNYG